MNNNETGQVEDNPDNTIQVDLQNEPEISAMTILLGAKKAEQRDTIIIKQRKGLQADLKLVVSSLTDKQFKAIGEESQGSTARNRAERRGSSKVTKEVDNSKFLRLIVANAIIEPRLADQKLLEAHGVYEVDELIQKLFLSGEISQIAEKVMELSGWDEGGVVMDIEKVKN